MQHFCIFGLDFPTKKSNISKNIVIFSNFVSKFFGEQIIFGPACAKDRIVPVQGYRYIPVRVKSASQNLRNSILYHKD